MGGQRADLEYQRTQPMTESFQCGLDKQLHCLGCIKEVQDRAHAAPGFIPYLRIGNQTWRFDHKPEIRRYLRRIFGVWWKVQRAIEGAVDAYGAEERMPRIGCQTVARLAGFGIFSVPDHSRPTRIIPGRGTQPQVRRQSCGQLRQFRVRRSRLYSPRGRFRLGRGVIAEERGLHEPDYS